MNFELTKAQQNVHGVVNELGRARFAKRAARYDEKAELPLENIQDFKDARLLAATVGKDLGGLGGGPVETLVIMEEFGKALVVEPYVGTVVIAGGFLKHSGHPRAADG